MLSSNDFLRIGVASGATVAGVTTLEGAASVFVTGIKLTLILVGVDGAVRVLSKHIKGYFGNFCDLFSRSACLPSARHLPVKVSALDDAVTV